MRVVTVRMDESVYEVLCKNAKKVNRSNNNFIVQLILKDDKNEKK